MIYECLTAWKLRNSSMARSTKFILHTWCVNYTVGDLKACSVGREISPVGSGTDLSEVCGTDILYRDPQGGTDLFVWGSE